MLEGRVGQLRQELARHLPDYMVPSIVMWLDRLPLNVNGKVDRKALPSPAATDRPGIVPAEGPVASAIAALWSEVLGTPQVGLDDNFFDLGGHSLLLIRMHKLLEERLRIELPLMDLFQHTSVGALVRHIESGGVAHVAEEARARGEQRRAALLRRRPATERIG
jgi:acyl carrier protein